VYIIHGNLFLLCLLFLQLATDEKNWEVRASILGEIMMAILPRALITGAAIVTAPRQVHQRKSYRPSLILAYL
jgi:hypothetical protein